MPSSKPSVRRSLAGLAVFSIVLLGAVVYWQARDQSRRAPDPSTVAVNTSPAPAASVDSDQETLPPAPPGVEVVPETEAPPAPGSETRQSFGRLAGLHRTKDPLRLVSSAAVAIDQDTGRVLVQKNEDAVLPVASLTKLMTGLLVAEAKLSMDETITITDDDVDNERHSRSRLRVGTELTRAEALHLAMMSSENRAAHALGRTFPGGLEKFVSAMNNRARQLGMKNTTFVDPTGLSNRNQSTARDISALVMAASKHEMLRDYSTTPRHQVEFGKRTLLYNNSNRLVKNPQWDIRLQKTGYIIEAGQCVTMHTRIGGHNVVMVLLDATDKKSRAADAERIRKWVSSQADGDDRTLALGKQGNKS